MLDDGIREMETLVSRYQTDGPDFLDGVPKQLLPDLYYLGDFGGTAVYGVFAASRFFLVGAGGQPGLVEFVKTRLRQLGREPVDPTAVLLTSGGPDVRPGLKEIVEQCRAQVVAAPAALDSLKDSCPAGTVLLSAAELPARGWFTVTPIPLGRRGVAPMAYRVEWAGKSVLFSGRLPLKITPRTVAELAADVGESRTDWHDYVASLSDIRRHQAGSLATGDSGRWPERQSLRPRMATSDRRKHRCCEVHSFPGQVGLTRVLNEWAAYRVRRTEILL